MTFTFKQLRKIIKDLGTLELFQLDLDINKELDRRVKDATEKRNKVL